MRRFPRPFPPDNDTAPKNDLGIPEAGHKQAQALRSAVAAGGVWSWRCRAAPAAPVVTPDPFAWTIRARWSIAGIPVPVIDHAARIDHDNFRFVEPVSESRGE